MRPANRNAHTCFCDCNLTVHARQSTRVLIRSNLAAATAIHHRHVTRKCVWIDNNRTAQHTGRPASYCVNVEQLMQDTNNRNCMFIVRNFYDNSPLAVHIHWSESEIPHLIPNRPFAQFRLTDFDCTILAGSTHHFQCSWGRRWLAPFQFHTIDLCTAATDFTHVTCCLR